MPLIFFLEVFYSYFKVVKQHARLSAEESLIHAGDNIHQRLL